METRSRIPRSKNGTENQNLIGKSLRNKNAVTKSRSTLSELQSAKSDAQPRSKLAKVNKVQVNNEQKVEIEEKETKLAAEKVELELLEKAVEKVRIDDNEYDYMVGKYVDKVYDYLRFAEVKYFVRPRYLDNKTDITSKMRSILTDWLVQVHKRFKLTAETLYLTISIMDRYIQAEEDDISKNDMQLIGISSMMLASKFEEIYSPEIGDYVYICDNAYTADQFLKQEMKILKVLDFEISQPFSIQFLRRYSKTAGVEGRQHVLAKYFLELALIDYDLMSFMPSIVAAAALKLSIKIIGNQSWSKVLELYSGYTAEELEDATNILCRFVYMIQWTKQGQKFTAVKKKYSESKNFQVATCDELLKSKDMLIERARKGKEEIANRGRNLEEQAANKMDE